MTTVQLFRRESVNFARFDDINSKHRDANIDSIFYYAVFYPAIEIMGAMAAALIIWYGGLRVIAGDAHARRAGRVFAVLVALLPSDQRHVGEVQHPAGAMASSERIFKLLDEPVVIHDAAAPIRRDPCQGRRAHRLRPCLVRLQRRGLRVA